MRIVVTGGGTAGHVTPVLAVAAEIKKQRPNAEITFFRQIGDKSTVELIQSLDDGRVDATRSIAAGKFRRYHGVPWTKQALDIPMQLKNIRDGFFFAFGLAQSLIYLFMKRPEVVFVKGGYVGLPVGLAASWLGIPLVIHESDTIMGLTNRTLSRRAAAVGVGMPEINYDLLGAKVVFVGVPTSDRFHKITDKEQGLLKESLGLKSDDQLVFITGGSQGAERVNQIAAASVSKIAKKAFIIHQAGEETIEEAREEMRLLPDEIKRKYSLEAFIDDMPAVMGAADVVVSRVGATTVSELAILAKPVVLIPNPKLVYGHQLKNAEAIKNANAAVVVDEADALANSGKLSEAVLELLSSKQKRKELSENINKLAKPNAVKEIADLIISQV